MYRLRPHLAIARRRENQLKYVELVMAQKEESMALGVLVSEQFEAISLSVSVRVCSRSEEGQGNSMVTCRGRGQRYG